jgi:hypothetical protein
MLESERYGTTRSFILPQLSHFGGEDLPASMLVPGVWLRIRFDNGSYVALSCIYKVLEDLLCLDSVVASVIIPATFILTCVHRRVFGNAW